MEYHSSAKIAMHSRYIKGREKEKSKQKEREREREFLSFHNAVINEGSSKMA